MKLVGNYKNDIRDLIQGSEQYIIPNDSYGKTDISGDGSDGETDATSYNIKLKSNYMCTINPMEITTLNITLNGFKTSLVDLYSPAGGKIIIGLFIKKHR